MAGELASLLLDSNLDGLKAAPDTDIESWVSEGREASSKQRLPNPRLWAWTGVDFSGPEHRYMAEAEAAWDQKKRALELAAAKPSTTALDWVWVGNSRYYDYRPRAALDAWKTALKADPTFCLAWANRAYALRQLGARGAALDAAEKATACDPNDREFRAERDLLQRLVGDAARDRTPF